MKLKLGEYLIQTGKITQTQLHEVLKEQAIFGGRLGTNLIEMGFIEEEELTQFLSEKTGLPCATPDQLMNVAPQVVALIPEELASRYRVMPLELEQRRLTIAMADPCDFAAIDELSFITGLIIKPLITPELRLVCALEKHYHIMREARYIRVDTVGRRRTPAPAPPGAARPHLAPPTPAAPAPEAEERLEFAPLEGSQTLSLPGDPTYYLVGANEGPPVPPAPRLEQVLQEFADARDRQRVAELVVGYAAQRVDRVALLLVRPDKALGWVAQQRNQPLPGFQHLELPFATHPLLQAVAHSRSPHLGAIPSGAPEGGLQRTLGSRSSEWLLVVPLIVLGKAVALLYLEAKERPTLEAELPELQKLLAKAAYAFEILILRNKILLS